MDECEFLVATGTSNLDDGYIAHKGEDGGVKKMDRKFVINLHTKSDEAGLKFRLGIIQGVTNDRVD